MREKQKKEQDIMQNWQGDINEPVASICCITYNHEPYIEDALEGFLMQVTNFPFEVLINDDASTDNTAKIIKKYEARFPHIIRPIYQRENQFTKGIKPNPTFNFPRVKGQYIALCEGDDYWVEKNKLQIQIDKMLKNNSIAISFHKAFEIDCDTLYKTIVSEYSNHNCFANIKDNFRGRGLFMPTASMVFKAEHIDELITLLDKYNPPIIDLFLQIFYSLKGKVLYINGPYSVYRRNSVGSWTSNQKKNKSKKKEYSCKMSQSILRFYNQLKNEKGACYLYITYTFYALQCAISHKNWLQKALAVLRGCPLSAGSLRFISGYFTEILFFIKKKIKRKLNIRNHP